MVLPASSRALSRADHEAARWLADRDSGLLDAAAAARLEAWLKTPDNAQAFSRAQALWDDMGFAADPARTPVSSLPTPQIRRRPPVMSARIQRWTPIAATGMVAGLVLAVMGLDLPTRIQADAITRPGEQRSLTLDDGSVVQMNTDTAVAVAYSPDRRTVRLLRGEAAFTVAADADRPFVVEAGGGSATALGTRFIVRRRADLTQVSVTEHSIRAASPLGAVVVPESRTTAYGPQQAPSAPVPSPVGAGAWTTGWLVFEDRPLSEVVEEIARYSPAPMAVIGQTARARRISGAFRIDQPGKTIAHLEHTLGVRSTRLIGGAVVLHD